MTINAASGAQAEMPGNDAEDNLDRDLDQLFDDGEFDEIDGETIVNETDVEDDSDAVDPDAEAEEAEGDEDAGEEDDGEADDQNVERVRSGMQKRIDRLTAQKKDLEEKFKDAESEGEKRKQEAETARLAALAGIDPEYAEPRDAEVVQKYDRLTQVRDWCRQYAETGYEGKGGNDPSFEPEDIRRRLDQVQDELMVLAPRAEQVRDEARSRMREDLDLGRKVRLARERKRLEAKNAVRKPRDKAAKVDGQTAGRIEKTSRSKNAGIDRKAFEESAGSEEDLVNSMGSFFD